MIDGDDTLKARWLKAFRSRRFLAHLVLTVGMLIAFDLVGRQFLVWAEGRGGVVLRDPIFPLLPRVDVTWPIFVGTYSTVVLVLFDLRRYPERIVVGFQTFVTVMWCRVLAIYLLPLDGPADTIALADPFAQWLVGNDGPPVTKDLFYSGHIGMIATFACLANSRWARATIIAIGAWVALALLMQRVHYAVDIYAAPFFAYTIYAAFQVAHRKSRFGLFS